MNKMNKKGQLGFQLLVPIMLTIGIAGIIGAFTLNIQGDIQDDFTANSLEYNATGDAMTGVSNVTGKIPILGLVGVALVIIAALISVASVVRNR